MLYAMLAAVPTVTPTASPIPTPTASPLPVFVSIVENTANKPGFLENVGAISSIIISFAAFIVSVVTIIISIQQNRKANRIAVINKAFEIQKLFNKEINKPDFFITEDTNQELENLLRIEEIRYYATMIFNKRTYTEIESLLRLVLASPLIPKLQGNESFIECAKSFGFENYLERYSYDDPNKKLIIVCVFLRDKANEILEKYRLQL